MQAFTEKMNYSVVFLLAATIVAACARPSEFDREVDHHWEEFKIRFTKKYNSNEESERKENFRRVHQKIIEHNKLGKSYTMGHNHLSDWHDHEKAALNGAKVPTDVPTPVWTPGNASESRNLRDSAWDWRWDPCLQPIKDQQTCGSCWTFSAIAPLEFFTCKKTGQPINLSEQQLIDCDTSDGGCNGGNQLLAYQYLQQQGSEYTNYYPYKSAQGSCQYYPGYVGATVASSEQLASNPDTMVSAVQYGPLAVIVAVDDAFYSYSGGIFSEPGCSSSSALHGVAIVGYGEEGGYPYWIIRNSWNTWWGESGYARMQRGVNMCGIETYPYKVYV